MAFYLTPPPANPLTRLLGAVLAVLAVVGFFLVGFVAVLLAIGFAIVAWVGLNVRRWWYLRHGQQRSTGQPAADRVRSRSDSATIDAEYEVVERKSEPRDL